MKNKRILFVYDFPLWGNGSATFMRELCNALLPLGYKIAIVAPDKRQYTKKIKTFTANPKVIPVFVGHPELPNAPRYTQLTSQELRRIENAFCRTTLRAIREFKPDILHINHLMLISWAGRIASALMGVRFLITCHGSDLHLLEKDRRLLHLTRDALRGAHFITMNSSDTRQWFTKIFGGEFKKKSRTIPAGIDLTLYPNNFLVKKIEKKYKLENKNVVLFVGRLTSQKGVKFLVKAAPQINGEIFIIGDGPEKDRLERLAKRIKAANMHFLGYFGARQSRELKEFYYRAQVVVVPSIWQEPLGLVVLEAMACKTPVVASTKGALSKIIRPGINGYLVRAKSSKDLADKINKILDDPQLRRAMGINARQLVKKHFNWQIIAQYFHRLYQAIPAPANFEQPIALVKDKITIPIIVLGGGIKRNGQLPNFVLGRLKLAKKLQQKYQYPVIVSGKYSFLYEKPYPQITEAEAMAKELQKMGVADVTLEKRAKDTISNAYYLKKILKVKKAIIITSPFHLSRVKFICKKVFGPDYRFAFLTSPARVSAQVLRRQRELLKQTKEFLYNMKDGDDQFLRGKFYRAPYYRQMRPEWVKKFVSQGNKKK